MSEIVKSPVNENNPARLPVRYRIALLPGTLEERLLRANFDPARQGSYKVDPNLAGEFWIYLFRHPTAFSVPAMKESLVKMEFEVGRLEHLLAFAERFQNESAHYPLVALGTSKVSPYFGDWDMVYFPALRGNGNVGSVSVDYKEYNKWGGEWIEDDVTYFGVRAIK